MKLQVTGLQRLLRGVFPRGGPHYGNRSEKLVEFELQPFRSQPRIRVVDEEGKPVKRGSRKPKLPEPAADE